MQVTDSRPSQVVEWRQNMQLADVWVRLKSYSRDEERN
jgi:hypothetical protein